MRVRSAALAVSAGILFCGMFAKAQGPRKPGLWEITTTTTWQKTPFPAGPRDVMPNRWPMSNIPSQ